MARRWSRHNYGYLRHLIERSLDACPGFGARVEVEGKIEPITEGLWHQNYRFWLQSRKSTAGPAEQGYILRLLEQRYDWQAGPEPRERLLREAETLQFLKRADFPHPTAVVNLSPSGLCVRVSSPLARQSSVTIKTPLPITSPVALVRWLEDAGDGAYLAGLECVPPQ